MDILKLESLVESGCAEHGAATEGGVEGVKGKGEQQCQSCQPDPGIPGGELRRDWERTEYKVKEDLGRERQETEPKEKSNSNSNRHQYGDRGDQGRFSQESRSAKKQNRCRQCNPGVPEQHA